MPVKYHALIYLLCALSAPLLVVADTPSKVAHLGYMSPGDIPQYDNAFLKGLERQGYIVPGEIQRYDDALWRSLVNTTICWWSMILPSHRSKQTKCDLLETLDDRHERRSTIVTSQLPVDQWHAFLADPTLADAILDRLVHNSYRLALKEKLMRKHKSLNSKLISTARSRGH